jgi:hypothetical protein
MTGPEDPTTRELRIRQADREAEERRKAETADTEEETDEHARRAEKAAYLREKLEERADAEKD